MRKFLILLYLLTIGYAGTVCAAKLKAKHVILIALDGWGAYSVPKADIPNIKNMMDNGCYTLHKRSVLPSSSAINWASMFMGAGTELHGYTQWGSRTPELPSRVVNQHGIFPTIFQIMRDQNPKAEIGCLYEWEGIKYLIDTLSLSHHALVKEYKKNPSALCEMSVRYIKEKRPVFLAICFDQLDHIGHQAGHDTPEYYKKLNELDQYIGRIVEAVNEVGMLEDTIFMLTSDHGGIGTKHGGITLQEVEIPFIIAGKNIRKGGEFNESMMQFDTASTIAYVFGLKQPQVWIGRPMKQVFK